MKTLKVLSLISFVVAMLVGTTASAQDFKSKTLTLKSGKNEVEVKISALSQKTVDEIASMDIKLVKLTKEEMALLKEGPAMNNKSKVQDGTQGTSDKSVSQEKASKEEHLARNLDRVIEIEVTSKSMDGDDGGFAVEFEAEANPKESGATNKTWRNGTGRRYNYDWYQFFYTYKWYDRYARKWCRSYKILVQNLSNRDIWVDFYYEANKLDQNNAFQGSVDDYSGYRFKLPNYGSYCWYSWPYRQVGALVWTYRNTRRHWKVCYWYSCSRGY